MVVHERAGEVMSSYLRDLAYPVGKFLSSTLTLGLTQSENVNVPSGLSDFHSSSGSGRVLGLTKILASFFWIPSQFPTVMWLVLKKM